MTRSLRELERINGSSTFGTNVQVPSRAEFQRAFNITSLSNYDRVDYEQMEKLFRRRPNNLPDDVERWLATSGRRFYQSHARLPASHPVREKFLIRLKAYLDYQDALQAR